MEDRDRDDHRPGLGNDDRDEGAQRTRAVYGSRLVHLARNGQQVLAQQEDVVGVGEEGWHQQG